MDQRYYIVLQFNGSRYFGWQIQPAVPTVQAELNEKLSILLKGTIETTGAGRTDTGVHAKYFVAHFDLEKEIKFDFESLVHKLNRFISKDIRIIKIIKVNNKAHARYDAISRTYRYYISQDKEVFNSDCVWQYYGNLEIDLMNKGAEIIKQYKDFTSFSKLHSDVKTNLCNIESAFWVQNGSLLIFTITADRFLRNMVRSIVGTLLLLGRRKIDLNDLRIIIESKNRAKAGESVPAKGLFLENIIYPFII
jgi:tRNA pseudouridine38-40 synthase